MSFFTSLVASLSHFLDPLFGGAATAAAIVVCTVCVRLALHPLARAAVRGERTRARLAPRMTELQRRHGDDPQRLRRELAELQQREGASPMAGCLPLLLQLPVFFAMYHAFTADRALLGHTLLGAPLGGRWLDALRDGGLFGAHGLVYLALFGIVAAVAAWSAIRTRRALAVGAGSGSDFGSGSDLGSGRRAGAGSSGAAAGVLGSAVTGRILPLLSFSTLITVAAVPLAAALYVVTSTTWTAVERAALGAGRQLAESPSAPAAAASPRSGTRRRSST
jgi:YidC/Oxa1 family membrane protein insertase